MLAYNVYTTQTQAHHGHFPSHQSSPITQSLCRAPSHNPTALCPSQLSQHCMFRQLSCQASCQPQTASPTCQESTPRCSPPHWLKVYIHAHSILNGAACSSLRALIFHNRTPWMGQQHHVASNQTNKIGSQSKSTMPESCTHVDLWAR